jgi:hypothetical protein
MCDWLNDRLSTTEHNQVHISSKSGQAKGQPGAHRWPQQQQQLHSTAPIITVAASAKLQVTLPYRSIFTPYMAPNVKVFRNPSLTASQLSGHSKIRGAHRQTAAALSSETTSPSPLCSTVRLHYPDNITQKKTQLGSASPSHLLYCNTAGGSASPSLVVAFERPRRQQKSARGPPPPCLNLLVQPGNSTSTSLAFTVRAADVRR